MEGLKKTAMDKAGLKASAQNKNISIENCCINFNFTDKWKVLQQLGEMKNVDCALHYHMSLSVSFTLFLALLSV